MRALPRAKKLTLPERRRRFSETHPVPVQRYAVPMVTHLVYKEEHYANPAACVERIRRCLGLGWILTQIRGPASGPFVALYQIEMGR